MEAWVRDANGTPVPNASVGFYKEGEGEILHSVQTNSAGYACWTVHAHTPGVVLVTAFKPLYRTGKRSIHVYHPDAVAPDGGQSKPAGIPLEFAVRIAPVVRNAPRVRVDVPGPARLRLTIHDVTGRMITKMADVNLAPGRH
ncbi:MAG: Ig-like domain-containing protein [bacterium]